jgi:hypothetical protein
MTRSIPLDAAIAEAEKSGFLSIEDLQRLASPQPANPAQVTDAVEKLRRQVEAANPNHKTMFVYVDDLRTALAAIGAGKHASKEPRP